jgi:DGQHR domain-containing protein
METTRKTIPAIACRQWLIDWNEYSFPEERERPKPPEELIIFSMPARLLRKLAGVYVRERKDGVATGIQRTHEKDRSTKISQFVRTGYPFGDLTRKQQSDPSNEHLKKPGWLPTAIVVNILQSGDMRRDQQVADKDLIKVMRQGNGSALELELPNEVNSSEWSPEGFSPIEVIDGQHRLFAFDEGLPDDFELPVVAFHGLGMGWQAYLFWSINVSPKKINPSHAYDLFPLLRTQDWLEATPAAHVYREARAQELTELLFRHPSSPWKNRINMLGERSTGWVSQAGWVQSLFQSFLKLGTTNRGRKGLFASNLNQTKGPLNWSRPQQAAFIIYIWKCLQDSVREKTEGWPTSLREDKGPQIDFQDNHDLAFTGPKTLLNQEQGIRGFSLALNDILWIQAVELKLDNWNSGDVDGGDTRDGDIDACIHSLELQNFATPIREGIQCLAEFDWRSYDAKSLSKEESQLKAGYRGTGGYNRIRTELLEKMSKQDTLLGRTAKNILLAEEN